jgi:hypothetical protein
MYEDRDRQYHADRARAELDQAYRADHAAVVEAHMRLSALHMDRLRAYEDRSNCS